MADTLRCDGARACAAALPVTGTSPSLFACQYSGCNYPDGDCLGDCGVAFESAAAVIERQQRQIADLRIAVLNWAGRAERAEGLLAELGVEACEGSAQ